MKRILLADDSPQALRLGEQILSGQGIQVVSVTDGATALRRLADVDPDILIVDVYLPAKNGFELARFIKAQAEWKHVRIIFAAGITDQFDEQDARNAGADFIIRKPFEASALLAAMEPLLEQAEAERSKKPDTKPTLDRGTVRAAVTIALDSAVPALIEELTDRVLIVLRQQLVREQAPVNKREQPIQGTAVTSTEKTAELKGS
jgi:DNA-binding response OmpR family regulator